ncbi:MAG: serine/threonine protein kinase, partial [Myxococcales bacterium]|nr:serine/threonine protein kinase [Myxococcales bacterium]
MAMMLELVPGTVFGGDFRVVRLLGEGGMGAVYLAVQESTSTPRALKLMQRELVADPQMRERFEQEARLGSRIESDHVVQVVAAGVHAESGVPWIAMELLRGLPLDAYLGERGRLAPGEVRYLFEQLCHALGAAHARGIVHRDLKPANVFLTAPRVVGLAYVVKVLDFGIAKVLAEAKTTRTAAMGTPLYMAPEQYHVGTITPATDVWALGLIAFELLAGRSYWRAAEGPDATPAKLMYETCMGELGPASARAGELGLEAALPEGFDAWFERAVCREPAGRFATARAACEALAPILGAAEAPRESLRVPALGLAELDAELNRERGRLSGEQSPFRGLLPFTEQHAALFFGRDEEIAEFLERLR